MVRCICCLIMKIRVQIPAELGGLQIPVTPAPRDMTPSSALRAPVHAHTATAAASAGQKQSLSWAGILVRLVCFLFVLGLLFLIGSHVTEAVQELTEGPGLECLTPPASTFQVLGLQAYSPRPCVSTSGSVSLCRTQRAHSALSTVLCLALQTELAYTREPDKRPCVLLLSLFVRHLENETTNVPTVTTHGAHMGLTRSHKTFITTFPLSLAL